MDIQRTCFVGVDTHKFEHTAVAIDPFHQPQTVVTTPNDPRHFAQFVETIAAAVPAGYSLVFGLEDTQGLGRALAQWLVRRGYTVREVNPVYTDRERRHQPDPDKSDPKDAQAIAEVLYRHWGQLPEVQPDGRRKALKQAVAAREQLVRQTSRIKNQLHVLLHEQYPNYKQFFSDPFGVTARAFFSEFPSPAHLKGRGIKRLGAFFKKQTRNLGEPKAEQLLELIDKAAKRDRATDLRDLLVSSLIEQLNFLEQQLERLESELAALLAESEYQLRTMSGIGAVLAATFEAEIGPIERFQSADQLARYAGAAPADASSGTRKGNYKHRLYGRRRLNCALYRLALNQLRSTRDGRYLNPEARRYYERKLNEGKTPKAALRCLMRRLVDIIYALMRDRSAYRPPDRSLPPRKEIV